MPTKKKVAKEPASLILKKLREGQDLSHVTCVPDSLKLVDLQNTAFNRGWDVKHLMPTASEADLFYLLRDPHRTESLLSTRKVPQSLQPGVKMTKFTKLQNLAYAGSIVGLNQTLLEGGGQKLHHSKTLVAPSLIECADLGIFAVTDIACGEPVMIFEGQITAPQDNKEDRYSLAVVLQNGIKAVINPTTTNMEKEPHPRRHGMPLLSTSGMLVNEPPRCVSDLRDTAKIAWHNPKIKPLTTEERSRYAKVMFFPNVTIWEHSVDRAVRQRSSSGRVRVVMTSLRKIHRGEELFFCYGSTFRRKGYVPATCGLAEYDFKMGGCSEHYEDEEEKEEDEQSPTSEDTEEEEEEFEVRRIVRTKKDVRSGTTLYEVEWEPPVKGEAYENTWEPFTSVLSSPLLLLEYQDKMTRRRKECRIKAAMPHICPIKIKPNSRFRSASSSASSSSFDTPVSLTKTQSLRTAKELLTSGLKILDIASECHIVDERMVGTKASIFEIAGIFDAWDTAENRTRFGPVIEMVREWVVRKTKWLASVSRDQGHQLNHAKLFYSRRWANIDIVKP
jgi:hypothetical protein